MNTDLRADPAAIHRALTLLCEPRQVYELRALGTSKGTVSGCFDDLQKCAAAAVGCSDNLAAEGVYLTLNPIGRDLLARAANGVRRYAKHTTSDADVLRRRWFAIDFDPVRPAGISSNDAEHQAALERARQTRENLEALAWPNPILADSGNGAHLLYPIDLANDETTRNLVKRCLDALAARFNDEAVVVDKTTFNAARIWKVYGTAARKGDNMQDRPHRLARILEARDMLTVVTAEQLEALAALAPQAKRLRPATNEHPQIGGQRFNLDAFLSEHPEIRVKRAGPYQGGRRLILEACVFDPNHGGSSVAIIETPDGALGYSCLHDRCIGKHWADVRELFEPGYRARKASADASEGNAGKKKPTQADVLIELAKDNAELFHDVEQNCYALVKADKHVETHLIRGRTFRRWLLRLYFEKNKQSPNAEALGMAVNTVEAFAHFEGQCQPVFVRIAGDDDKVYVDLCNERSQVVEIDDEGWRVIESRDCPCHFVRRRGMLALPVPKQGGDVNNLRPFIPGDEATFKLIISWLISAYNPEGPYPILDLGGDQGAGKSTTQRVLRQLIDPNQAPIRAEPKDVRDLMIAANNGWIVAYDNLSQLQPWLSNALCRLSTGGGFGTRELFTDDEEKIFDAKRPVIVAAIANVLTKPDVLDRAIRVTLDEIPDDKRLPEKVFWDRFGALHASVLGAFLGAVSCAIRRRGDIQLPDLPRMADATIWVEAAAQALGLAPREFVNLYQGNRDAANKETIENSSVAQELIAFLSGKPWEGTAKELLEGLSLRFGGNARPSGWPKTPRGLSAALRRVRPNLTRVGVTIRFPTDPARHDSGRRGKKGDRLIVIEVDPDKVVAQSSASSDRQPDEKNTNYSEAFPGGHADGSKTSPAASPAQPSANGGQKRVQSKGLSDMSDGSDGSDDSAAVRSERERFEI